MADIMSHPPGVPHIQPHPPPQQSQPQQQALPHHPQPTQQPQFQHTHKQPQLQPAEPQSASQCNTPKSEGDKQMLLPNANRIATPNSANPSRRPPRKSTLTQQQKNQKRQRATQDQLMTLEVEFNKNPTPTGMVRERIAQDINMTERSVQIWFQNRRAKIKNIAKRSIESGEDCDSIPESMRQYLAMQAMGGNGKGLPAGILNRNGQGFGPFSGGLCLNSDASNGKVVIQHFACRSLSIGSWRRVGQSTMDLVIFYSPDKACVTYYINNDSAGYKIEYPFAWIKHISMAPEDGNAAAEGTSQQAGGLIIELNHPPKFYMDSSGSGGFYECGDFTEDQQASQILVHHLGGPHKTLTGQLAKLISLESFLKRHNTFDINPFAASAPVSPMRPASQPNHMLHPHHNNPHPLQMFTPEHAPGMMGPPAPRGHKRQRSRSVPAAIDVSMLRGPMPSFLVQHEGPPGPHAPPMHEQQHIFAPIPQHHAPPAFAPPPPGPGLSIDTSAAYAMGMQFNGPVSATTINSPSEYGTPAFFTTGPPAEAMTTAHFNTPFHNGFLAVDPSAMLGTSTTPISVTHHDPIIADHSPPMNGLGRSQSADLFGNPRDNSHLGDDGLFLSETFNKQMQLPFRSPGVEDSFNSPMPDGGFNFNSPAHESQAMSGRQNSITFDFNSPGAHGGSQQHQDSGISFSTPSHVPAEQASMFNSPKDGSVIYGDNKVYSSPGQMHGLPDEQSMYNSPLGNGNMTNEELDMATLGFYGTIDPNNLANHHQ